MKLQNPLLAIALMKPVLYAIALSLAILTPSVLLACSLCDGSSSTRQTLRDDARQAKVVLYGTLTNSRPNAGTSAGGTTDLKLETAIKSDPLIGGKTVLTLPKYVPTDPQKPQPFLVFCEIGAMGQIDPYRGFSVKSDSVVEYLKKSSALDRNDPVGALRFFFDYLGDSEPEIANDAFLEFAKSKDRDVVQAARKFDPSRLRNLIQNPQTADYKLSLLAYLLGACGGSADADYLAEILQKAPDRFHRAYGGVLAGFVQLRPEKGWSLARSLIADEKRSFSHRMAVLTMLRFFHAGRPEESKAEILQTLYIAVKDGTIADLAIEDLRRWEWWDLTTSVVDQFGKKSHEAPMTRRAIVRYAICCPNPEAKSLVAQARKLDEEMVKDVEEALAFEKANPGIK